MGERVRTSHEMSCGSSQQSVSSQSVWPTYCPPTCLLLATPSGDHVHVRTGPIAQSPGARRPSRSYHPVAAYLLTTYMALPLTYTLSRLGPGCRPRNQGFWVVLWLPPLHIYIYIYLRTCGSSPRARGASSCGAPRHSSRVLPSSARKAPARPRWKRSSAAPTAVMPG